MALLVVSPDVEMEKMMNRFYNIIKNGVWRVKISSENGPNEMYTGVCIGKKGLILTGYFDTRRAKVVVYGPNGGGPVEADLVHAKHSRGLALVRVKAEHPAVEYDYVELSSQRKFEAGETMYSLSFSMRECSPSMLEGYLSVPYHPNDFSEENKKKFPYHNTMKGLRGRIPDVGHSFLDDATSFLEVDRINRAAGRGAPVFDITGRLVGLVALEVAGCGFAIHVDHLREFVEGKLRSGEVISCQESCNKYENVSLL